MKVKNFSIKDFIKRVINSKFVFQSLAYGFFLFFVMSFRPPYLLSNESEYFGFEEFGEKVVKISISESGFLDNYAGIASTGLQEVLIQNEDGTTTTKRIPRKREHTTYYFVKSGDNINGIAHKFMLEPRTIYWTNNLTVKSTLQIGQKLMIPPVDGIYYEVREDDTLSEIAKIHDIELAKINSYNKISAGKIKPKDVLFLPEARKIYIADKPKVKDKPTLITRRQKSTPTAQPTTIKSMGITLRRPTKGILTQGYHRDHYAIDIANKLNTPIYAAEDGVVEKSATGWNYGYGSYIIIDHGNDVKTLYGHNNILKVSKGDHVKKGQLISLMGNTGRVFGVTGIHLHFEVRIRGRKVNPNSYF